MIIKTKEHHIEELREKAHARGGKLISTVYINNTTKYEFEDINGNRFFSSGSSIKSGRWCREGLVTEPLCRQVMEHLFQDKFPSTFRVLTGKVLNRPRPLELDGYCEQLKIAFEYQGNKSHWFKDHPIYNQTIIRDKLKIKFCKKLGIHLVVIPKIKETRNKWNSENIFNHVLESIRKSYKNLDMPTLNLNKFIVDLSKNSHAFKKINELKEISHKNKGKLISTSWKGARDLHIFQFEDGRNFEITPDSLKSQGWPKDPDFFLKTSDDRYNELKKLVENNRAILLEKKWNGCDSRHKIKLECNTIISIIPESVKRFGWVKAPSRYLTDHEKLLKIVKIAKDNNGEILETKWLGIDTKHKIKLASGKLYSVSPYSIHLNGWPKDTGRNLNGSEEHLAELATIALKNKGKLLSAKWICSKTKYEFQFEDGRNFFITANKIRSRGWPPNPDYYFNQMKSEDNKITFFRSILYEEV